MFEKIFVACSTKLFKTISNKLDRLREIAQHINIIKDFREIKTRSREIKTRLRFLERNKAKQEI